MNKILLLSIILTLSISLFAQDESTLVKIGDNAPEFTYDAGNGVRKSLSDLKGKVVFINFFATWCPPCRKELPQLQKEIFDVYKDNEDFVLLIFGREQNWKTIDEFKEDNNFTMPFYPDLNRKIFSKFATQSIPRNFIIDKEGKIAYSAIGYTEEEFEKLKGALAKELN